MVKVLWLYEDYAKTPDWLRRELDLYFAVLTKYIKRKLSFPVEFTARCEEWEYLLLLTTGIFNHPCNTVNNEPGWCDITRNKVIYVSVYEWSFYDSLASFFRLKSREWFWEMYNGWKIAHEIFHLVLWLKNDPDWLAPDRYLPYQAGYIYVDTEGNEVEKDGDWEIAIQRPQ